MGNYNKLKEKGLKFYEKLQEAGLLSEDIEDFNKMQKLNFIIEIIEENDLEEYVYGILKEEFTEN